MPFTQKEKREHYNAVAKKIKPVKDPSKFSPQTQVDYARGQAHARNESAAIYKYKNSTNEEREGYRQRQEIKRQAMLTAKCSLCGKPCAPNYAQCYACFKSRREGSGQDSLAHCRTTTTFTEYKSGKTAQPAAAPVKPAAKPVAKPAPSNPRAVRERKCGICGVPVSKCHC